MSGCGCGHGASFDGMNAHYKKALILVIAINASMFVVEMTSGLLSGSMALRADALDFLGDSLTYGLSLLVIGQSLQTRSKAALFKAFSLFAMGLWVFGATLFEVLSPATPEPVMMGSTGILALLANLASVGILFRYRDGDANVRSVWLCSRNDAIGNLAVIGAASGVWASQSAWPDLIVAGLMAGLFTTSAIGITRQALREYRSEDSCDLPASGGKAETSTSIPGG